AHRVSPSAGWAAPCSVVRYRRLLLYKHDSGLKQRSESPLIGSFATVSSRQRARPCCYATESGKFKALGPRWGSRPPADAAIGVSYRDALETDTMRSRKSATV